MPEAESMRIRIRARLLPLPIKSCMRMPMTDTISILKDRLAKAQAKIQRYEKSLESAKNEVADIHTTLRILGEIGGESAQPSGQGSTGASKRQGEILLTLANAESNATTPAELFERYKILGSEDINLDTFRTAVWRMKDKTFLYDGLPWTVMSHDGKYWKECQSADLDTDDDAVNRAPAHPMRDIDEEVPF